MSRTLITSLTLALALTGCKGDVPEGDGGIALRSFQTCDQVHDYMGDVVLETLIQAHYGGYGFAVDVAMEDSATGGNSADKGGPADYSTTNNQEVGVDEVDIVKTDGDYIYVVEGSELIIVDSWPVEDTSVISRVELGSVQQYGNGLFLDGDQVVTFSTTWYDQGLSERWWAGTKINWIDVSDRAHPVVTRTTDVEGYLADARMIDGDVYAVYNTWMDIPEEAWELLWSEDGPTLPEHDWEAPEEEQDKIRDEARRILQPYVDAIMADEDVTDMLPMMRDQRAGVPNANITPMHACHELYRPGEISQHSVLTVQHLDLDAGKLHHTGVLSDGWEVYASQDNLYVGQSSWWSWWGWGDLDMRTTIHKFALKGQHPRYVASGAVPGWTLNQFSMSEYQGDLRVATTETDWWWGTEGGQEGSAFSVLRDAGNGYMYPIGMLRGIQPGEWITSVRMQGPKAYMVTFERTDPLFTIDARDPFEPKLVGELELPGFSSYLHPMGDDHLLAVGQSGTWDGVIDGLAITVFDVSDFTNPKVAHELTFRYPDGGWAWSEALWDHHAFTYHAGVLSIPFYESGPDPVTGEWRDFSGLLVVEAGPDGLQELGRVDHADLAAQSECAWVGYGYYEAWYPCEEAWWATMRRSLYIGDADGDYGLYSLSNYGIKVNDLADPSVELAQALFHPK